MMDIQLFGEPNCFGPLLLEYAFDVTEWQCHDADLLHESLLAIHKSGILQISASPKLN